MVKGVIKGLLGLVLVGLVSTNFSKTYAQYYPIEDQYHVEGGKVAFDFEDENQLTSFDAFTQFLMPPFMMDGSIYFDTLSESKFIYNEYTFTDVDVSVDINTINPHGKFDTGIYIGTDFDNPIDHCIAYEVNLEKGADQTRFYLKVHRFYYGWRGAQIELSNLKLPTVDLNLRVVVKSGILYAFVNHEKTPRLNLNIGIGANYVGIRNYYSPNYIDNFTVIGNGLEVQKTKLDQLIAQADALDGSKYTTNSYNELMSVLVEAKNAQQSSNQYAIDKYTELLEKALANLVIKRTASELDETLVRAKAISNGDEKYTLNSFKALTMVIAICENVDRNNEDDVSYWCNQLDKKIEALTEYIS